MNALQQPSLNYLLALKSKKNEWIKGMIFSEDILYSI